MKFNEPSWEVLKGLDPSISRKKSNPRPSVCFISCGGTIASRDDPIRGRAVALTAQELMTHVPRVAQIAAVMIPKNVGIAKDSTNMRPADWELLAARIFYEYRTHNYSAFVVTHGTDTMAYTASALALAFGRALPVPIVLTGSQMPIEMRGTDGVFNLENAFRTAVAAVHHEHQEIMVCFGHHVLRGSRIRKRSESEFEAFESPVCDPLVVLRDEIEFAQHTWRSHDRCRENDPEALRATFSEGVVHLRLIPGLPIDAIEPILASTKVTGLVLESFGPGNVPNDNQVGYDITPLIRRAVEMRKPVVVTTPFIGGRVQMDRYAVGKAAFHAGAISAGNMTVEMAAVKLMWLLGQKVAFEDLRIDMAASYVDEQTGPPVAVVDRVSRKVMWSTDQTVYRNKAGNPQVTMYSWKRHIQSFLENTSDAPSRALGAVPENPPPSPSGPRKRRQKK